jgi:hypothetical protein
MLNLFVEQDPEEGSDELVAALAVNLDVDSALQRWEELARRLYAARAALPEEERDRMDASFAFRVGWPENAG